MSAVERATSSGTEYPRTLTKVTSGTFFLQQYDIIIAVKTAGQNAGKEIRGAFVVDGTGVVEFSNNSDYTVYKGSTSGNINYIDIFAKIEFQKSDMVLKVGMPEVPEGTLQTDVEDFPLVYDLQ